MIVAVFVVCSKHYFVIREVKEGGEEFINSVIVLVICFFFG